jgi:hypothetical protein
LSGELNVFAQHPADAAPQLNSLRGGSRRRGRSHLVVHVVVMVMMMVVVVMLHGRGRRSAGRSGFLRDGVAGEAEREHGGGGEGLDHGRIFLRLREPQRVMAIHTARCLNSI